MKAVSITQFPEPLEMHSGALNGTTILCAGNVLRVLSVGNLPWRKVQPGWYALTADEREAWGHWACWTAGYFQCGGLSWPEPPAETEAA